MTVFDILAQFGQPVPTGHGSSHLIYYVILGGSALLSWLVGSTLKRRFQQYSEIRMPMTGAQIAQKMLADNGIHDVKVISVPGQLTDHYNPADKTVNLSEGVYSMPTVAAAAVAAHECGHAVQHAQAYAALTMRSKLVPVVQLSSGFTGILIMIGAAVMASTGNKTLLLLGVAAMALSTLFAIVTLPVEFDASKRALVWLNSSGLSGPMEQDRAKNALFWAAMTYVVAALAAIGQLVYFASMLMGNRREE